MRRYFYVILGLFLLGIVPVSAQQMIVQTNDGDELKFEELDYASCKITFSEGQMNFHVGDVVKRSLTIKDIQRISFYGLQSCVGVEMDKNSVCYSSENGTLAVNVAPGTPVAVYGADGVRVLSYIQPIAADAISVSHLHSGVYVVVVGSETFKFVKP